MEILKALNLLSEGGKSLPIIKLWNFFRGYVIITIEGFALERFINYAITQGIYLWDIIRIEPMLLEAKVSLKGYKELRAIIKKTGCKIKIKARVGYPFFMHKIRQRKAFAAGLFIALFLIFTSSSFIWSIEIKGNTGISEQKIKERLYELGLFQGAFKYDLNIPEIENHMMMQLEELAWIGIELKGTKAIVEIAEKVKPPQNISTDIPCDIVATQKGIITKVIAKNGDALVKEGDIVKEGQILITGKIEREELDTRYVHALGEVFAKTYYEEDDEISLIQSKKVKTGNRFVRRIIRIGKNQIMLSIGENPYKNVIIEKKKFSFPSWKNIRFPVEMIVENYYEAKEIKETLDTNVVKKALEEQLTVKLFSKIPKDAEILNQNIEFFKENNKIRAKLIIEVQEQIGKQRRIQIEY